MRSHAAASATGATLVIVHVVLAILGTVAVAQWMGGIVVGTGIAVGGGIHARARRQRRSPDASGTY
ncbi:MAG: hypothetical protein ACRD0Q_08075 [Acidimicrobiales bacterium]